MTEQTFDPSHAFRSLLGGMRQAPYGFFYWLLFLLVLEPDNILRALRAGHSLAFDHEALRITAASLLGASVTPFLLWLTRTYPILGPRRWRHGMLHLIAILGLAPALIIASCFLAAWCFAGRWLPTGGEIHDELLSNGLLLVYAIAAFTAIAHAVHYFLQAADRKPAAGAVTKRIAVKARGRVTFLSPTEIDWVETQGNYLALHAGAGTHLIRETLRSFEPQLDADNFVRIHRRVIVAVDRIQSVRPVSNGDAILHLIDGRELRVSRRYREMIRQKWPRAGNPGRG